ncbi:Serine/threonine protein kinase [Nannocystis exedens]|uniref:Serine/threonine protein kinase n=1 Tax=Nannocystis exedens TaxID=54 RepID=A0A1I1YPD8_9BACT|nr:serine/threonine-protein kinase [Nannocystis exedens]PCC70238.1 Serine/threonine-protein kinase PrkC [Nannocystis exedens]SFE21391.1 Serine/threonine protein kinase [Nannocystis exedens]
MSNPPPTLRAPGSGGRDVRPGPDRPTGPTRATNVPHTLPDPIALEPGHEIGRFTVLSYLGAGAMGIVYAAYDPELDRKVALKVLRPQGRPDSHGRVRLHDEAQAMAKVSHPNVAVVHEVGLHEDGIFIAMEFVRGATLHAWLAKQPRTWTEILDAFIQAGRGLAAAHGAGLVHRDFKPSNAMIGDDGRVRVLDFGLSCTPAKAGREVVGTPAYMPPEQFLGQPVGPASDQFSFCASLYQALFGQLPFPGDNAEELRLTVTSGQVRTPPRHVRVPSRVSAAILRGLRQDPKDRFASMEELLRNLDHDRTRGRRTLMGAVFGAAVLGLGGGYLGARPQAADPCSDGAAQIDQVWNPDSRAAIEHAFAALPPAFAANFWPQVRGVLDDWSADWKRSYREACEARERHEFSEELALRSSACFERARAALASAVVVLHKADADVGLHALEVATSLPDPAECRSSAGLVAHTRASRDIGTAVRRRRVMARIEDVKVHARAGRTLAAKQLADDVIREAHALGDRPTLAEAFLQRGRLDIEVDPTRAEPFLNRAYLVALGAGEDNRVVEALALRLYARSHAPDGLPRAFEDLDVVTALLPRIGNPPSLQALVFNNAGSLYLTAGDARHGEPYLHESLRLRRAAGGDDVEVAKTLGNLALLAKDPARTRELVGESLQILEDNLGVAHPEAMAVRILAGALAEDPEDAVQLLERGCDALDEYRPDDLRARAECLQHLAAHAREAGEQALADQEILRARALIEHLPDADPFRFDDALIRGYAGLVDGTHATALAWLERTLHELRGGEWWQRRKVAEIELCIGLHLLAVGDVPGARRALADSVAIFEQIAAKAHDNVLPRTLAAARLALAEALSAGFDPEAAAHELAAAESWYRRSEGEFAWRMPAIAERRQ